MCWVTQENLGDNWISHLWSFFWVSRKDQESNRQLLNCDVFKLLFIYLTESTSRGSSRKRGRKGEGEAGSQLSREAYAGLMQGSIPRCPKDPRIMTWAKGRHSIDWATQVPLKLWCLAETYTGWIKSEIPRFLSFISPSWPQKAAREKQFDISCRH